MVIIEDLGSGRRSYYGRHRPGFRTGGRQPRIRGGGAPVVANPFWGTFAKGLPGLGRLGKWAWRNRNKRHYVGGASWNEATKLKKDIYKAMLGSTVGGYVAGADEKATRWMAGGSKRRRPSTRSVPRKAAKMRGPTHFLKDDTLQVRPRANMVRRHRKYGGAGNYLGAFRKGRRLNRRNPYRRWGSTAKLEVAGTENHANQVSIGHSVGTPQFAMQLIGRAILRRALERVGRDIITDWSANPSYGSGTYKHSIYYRTDPLSNVSNTGAVAFTAAISFAAMADELSDAIMAVYTEANDQIVLEQLQIFTNADTELSTIPLRGAILSLDLSSLITIQNVTESASGGTLDHSQVTDVRANPLVGRSWTCRSNTFIPHGTHTNASSVIANERTGLVSGAADATSGGTFIPAKNYYTNSRISAAVKLAPGGIKKSVLRYRKTLTINKFMMTIKRYLMHNANLAATAEQLVGMGPSRVFVFEHMMKDTGDPNVIINYEMALFGSAFLKYKISRDAKRVEYTS